MSNPSRTDTSLADQERARDRVRRHYAAAATSTRAHEDEAGCCGTDSGTADGCGGAGEPARFGAELYAESDRDTLPQAAIEKSLGCGNPTAVADLHRGETVLDLGSGSGTDLLLSARRVGPAGKVYGLDMTEEMLALARANLEAADATNVELLKGMIESIPLPARTVDVVISNCVINLSADKPAVFAEVSRVLKAGGRVGIADVVADDELSAADRAERGSHEACIAGALSISEYENLLEGADFTDVSIALTHGVADGMHGAIVKATKPEGSDTLDQ